mgnify:CR=1 FL=1
MENFVKQNPDSSNKEFEQLLMKDLSERKFTEGEIAKGRVSKIDDKFVFVDLGLKSEGAIPVEEFKLSKELDNVKVGSEIDVLLERLENISGELVISREKARRMRTWKKMEKAFENKEEVQGRIISKCKGGFVVDVDSCLRFLPGSQIDIRPNKTIDHLMKQPQTFECVKLDKKRGNIVLSRRAIQERKRNESRDEILSKLKEGEIIDGTVKSVVDWGAFLDLEGIDSLLHITDMSWSRVNKPSELVSVGQTLKVKIIKIENGKVSVSVKALTPDPYVEAIKKYKVKEIYKATISKVADYGAFAILESGLEGLIHQTELSWGKKNISARKVLSTSQQVDVQILEIDKEKRRISLSYKNTLPNPWTKMEKSYPVGSEFEGTVNSISDFGIFLSVPNIEIQGLVHYKDLSWSENPEILSQYKKNQKVKCKVVEIDLEKEKLRCSVRALTKDPFDFFKDKKEKDIVTVFVKDTTENSINVSTLKNDESSFVTTIKRNQIAVEKEDARPSRFSRGDKIDAMITEIDFEKRKVALSIKALEEQMNKEAVKKYGSQDSGASLGDILGKVLKKKKPKSKK